MLIKDSLADWLIIEFPLKSINSIGKLGTPAWWSAFTKYFSKKSKELILLWEKSIFKTNDDKFSSTLMNLSCELSVCREISFLERLREINAGKSGFIELERWLFPFYTFSFSGQISLQKTLKIPSVSLFFDKFKCFNVGRYNFSDKDRLRKGMPLGLYSFTFNIRDSKV